MTTSPKIALVTGANSGIGKAIAMGLAQSGAHVILVCRDSLKGQNAQADIKARAPLAKIDLLIADLSSQASVRELANKLKRDYSHLDILVNNAGIANKEKVYSIDHIEMTLATNYLAPFLLTHLAMDLLKSAPAARVVNISSGIHLWGNVDIADLEFSKRPYKFMQVYAQSKLLLTLTSVEFAKRLANTSITVNCVHPGAVKTQLGSQSATNCFWKLLERCIKFFFISPEKAAITPLYLATSPEVANISGQYFEKGNIAKMHPAVYNEALRQAIWEKSEQLVGISS